MQCRKYSVNNSNPVCLLWWHTFSPWLVHYVEFFSLYSFTWFIFVMCPWWEAGWVILISPSKYHDITLNYGCFPSSPPCHVSFSTMHLNTSRKNINIRVKKIVKVLKSFSEVSTRPVAWFSYTSGLSVVKILDTWEHHRTKAATGMWHVTCDLCL